MSHPVLDAAANALGVRLEYRGDLALLDSPRRCLLISRAERVPRPDSPWIRATVDSVRELVSHGETLVCGEGRVAYDAALWTCAQHSGRAIVVLANTPDAGDISGSMLANAALLVWPRESTNNSTEALRQRDQLMAELSDRAFAIHVRKAGNMAALAARFEERGISVEKRGVETSTASNDDEPRISETSADYSLLPDEGAWDYLTHFTREPDGAWPGETQGDYLRWLSAGIPFAPRDGFAALCRILAERRLRACGRLMPGAATMVCFTELHPNRTAALRRWRRGLLRWSFTRYGLAIRKKTLLRTGAEAVRYGTREAIQGAVPERRRFMQVERTADYDWSAEAEWRVAGDVDLAQIANEELLALVATALEAEHVTRTFGMRAAAIL